MFLDLNSNYKTLYMQLYEAIRQEIVCGKLEKNSKLPSLRTLMSQYQVSKNTVITAYYQLETEGYIRSIPKSGFYVNEIENLLITNNSKIKYQKTIQKKYQYDFGIDGVDTTGFPFAKFKKIFGDIMLSENDELLSSAEPKGDFQLRNEISKYLNISRGLNTTANDLIISAGTEHLFNFIKKLFPQNSIYGFENPGYAWGNRFFYNDLKHAIPINLDNEGINIAELDRYNIDICLTTPAHQFPTGTTMSIDRRIKLLNRAVKTNSYIIEDDYDSEFKYKGKPIPALKSMDLHDRVIYMGTFSKCLSPALRISYMVLPKEIMKKYDIYFTGYSSSCSTFIQKTLAEFMKQGYFEKHINKMRTIYGKKYEICENLLSKIPEIEINTSESGNSFLLKISQLKNTNKFLEDCKKANIRIQTVDEFSYKKIAKPEFLFGFAKIKTEDITNGINLLKKLIEQNNRVGD